MLPSKELEKLSASQAVLLGIACRTEQRLQLLKDAKSGDKYYYGRKVVDELEVSLDKLEQLYPSIRECIYNLSNTNCNSTN